MTNVMKNAHCYRHSRPLKTVSEHCPRGAFSSGCGGWQMEMTNNEQVTTTLSYKPMSPIAARQDTSHISSADARSELILRLIAPHCPSEERAAGELRL